MSYPPEQPSPGQGYGLGPSYVTPTNGKATASLVTGVASLALSLCPAMGFVGVVAIVLGFRARNEIRAGGDSQHGDGLALGGILTGTLAVILGVAVVVLIVVAVVAGVQVETGHPARETAF